MAQWRRRTANSVQVLFNIRFDGSRQPAPSCQFKPFALTDGDNALVWNQSHRWDPKTDFRGFEDELHYFLNCVSAGTKPEPDIADSAKTLALFEDMEQLLGKAF